MQFYVISLPPTGDRAAGPPWRGGPRVVLARLAAALTGAPPASFAALTPGSRGNVYDTREAAERGARAFRRAQPLHTIVVVEARSFDEAHLRAQSLDGALPPLAIDLVRTWDEMQHALAVRRAVFIDEQQVPEEEEIDEHDLPKAWGRTAMHVVGRLHWRPIATARLLLDAEPDSLPHIGRVAVLEEYRGHGYGRAIMEALHAEAQRRGYPGVTLAAQLHAIPFYERLGYAARGPVFLDAGIEHREMDLRWD